MFFGKKNLDLETANQELCQRLDHQAREVQNLSKKSSIAHFDVVSSKDQEKRMEVKIKDLTQKLTTVEVNHKKMVVDLEQKTSKVLSLEQQLTSKVNENATLKSEQARQGESFERKISELQGEISHLKTVNSELRVKSSSDNSSLKYKQHIQNLEAKFLEIRENTSLMTQKLDQVMFEKEQCTQTIVTLKQERLEQAECLEGLRKEKHALELQQIEEKDRYSELYVKSSGLQEDLTKAEQEVGSKYSCLISS